MSMIRRVLLASACVVLGSSGCCLEVVPVLPTTGGGGTTGRADGGPDAGPDAGDTGVQDAGSCLIDGKLVPAGTWLEGAFVGSCVICNPSMNEDDWTVLDGGQPCEALTSVQPYGPPTLPFSGFCGVLDSLECIADLAGGGCGQVTDGETEAKCGCIGGFCNDAGWCQVNENLGYSTSCGDPVYANPCAQGPCCLDAGFAGLVNGGGWCCGLIDGGVATCLHSGAVCYSTSDCCDGLTCTGHTAVFDSDAGYGFCE
jgi:hypothetical protein